MPSTGPQSNSSSRDNRAHHRGSVGEFLKSEVQPGCHLSFVSAYFTVHAYDALASLLEGATKLWFRFGEPSFVTGIDRGDKGKANFKLTEHGITIAKTLTKRQAAKACAEWIERMVEIRSIRQSNFLHGNHWGRNGNRDTRTGCENDIADFKGTPFGGRQGHRRSRFNPSTKKPAQPSRYITTKNCN